MEPAALPVPVSNREKADNKKRAFLKHVTSVLEGFGDVPAAKGLCEGGLWAPSGEGGSLVQWATMPASLDSASIITKSRSTGLTAGGVEVPHRILRKRWQVRPAAAAGHDKQRHHQSTRVTSVTKYRHFYTAFSLAHAVFQLMLPRRVSTMMQQS